ncbi:MAG: DNA-protecting protein DprA [Alphaproteobacteria bacterium]|nr:DNA-protecting protein DprA [Alphaproteobacteria bacterium]
MKINARKRLEPRERLAWLRLIRSENIGPATFKSLIERFGSAEAALDAVPRLAQRAGRRQPLHLASREDVEREMEAADSLGVRFIALCEPDYPPALAALDPAPPMLSLRGDAAFLARESIAMVGARNASALGLRFAGEIAGDLGREGLCVVSGMARGIDTAAHKGALETGTIAVLAGGVDNIYPPENRALYAALSERGAIVSEMPVGFAPAANHFPRRNRLISGLARGVLVTEAALNSGSLITARFALEQGREVFAVPGSPLDPRCRGTNNLIRQGAILTESADDVLQVLRPVMGSAFQESAAEEADEYLPFDDEPAPESLRDTLLERLSPTPIGIDDLIRDLGAEPGAIMAALMELELAGLALRQSGRLVVRI